MFDMPTRLRLVSRSTLQSMKWLLIDMS